MKGKLATVMLSLIVMVLLVGCPRLPKLEKLLLTTDATQMSGTPVESATLGVGETIALYARGCAPDGKWFVLPKDVTVEWKPSPEVEVTPTVGHEVTVKLISSPAEAARIEIVATTKAGEKISTVFTITPKKE